VQPGSGPGPARRDEVAQLGSLPVRSSMAASSLATSLSARRGRLAPGPSRLGGQPVPGGSAKLVFTLAHTHIYRVANSLFFV
jgi:hypothetical protein